MQIVKQLQELGFDFTLKETGEGFKIQYPGGKPPPEALSLLEELKSNRQAALAILHAQAAGEQAKQQVEEPSQEVDAEAAKVKAALLRNGLVKIYSGTLDEEVYWARDGKAAAKAPAGAVIYTMDELKGLARDSPTRESLRQVHEGKNIFGGTVRAGACSWEEIGQATQQNNRPLSEKDPYMLLFQQTLTELNKLLDGLDGLAGWLEKYRPGLARRISQSEEKLNQLWDRDLEKFKAELLHFHDLNVQAIRQFTVKEG